MATPKQKQRRPEQAPPREGRTMTLVKQAAAVVGLVSAVVGLLFLLVPQLRPDDSPATAPPAEQSGRLFGLVLDADTTQGQYFDRTDQPKLGFTPEQLALRGAFVRFQVEIVGYRGKEVPLQRELVDARTGDEIGQLSADTIVPTADKVVSPWHDWVALRPGKGRYVLVVKLLDEQRVRSLACVQSEPFGGLAGLAPGKRVGLCAAA